MIFERRETKRFSDAVEQGETWEETVELDYDATIEEVDVRFYRGPENAVGVLPFRDRQGDRLPLIDLHGKSRIYGDGDYWTFDVSESVEKGDVIGVEVVNDAEPPEDEVWTATYDVVVDVTLDRAGGASRVVSIVREVLPF